MIKCKGSHHKKGSVAFWGVPLPLALILWNKYFVDCLNALFCTKEAVTFLCNIILLGFKARLHCPPFLPFQIWWNQLSWIQMSSPPQISWAKSMHLLLSWPLRIFTATQEANFLRCKKNLLAWQTVSWKICSPAGNHHPMKVLISYLSFLSKEDFVTTIFPNTCFIYQWIIP